MSDILYNDSEFKKARRQYSAIASTVDEYLSEYIQILKSLVEDSAIKGAFGDALSEFTSVAEILLGGMHKQAVDGHANDIGTFIDAVETNDDTRLD